MYEIELEEFGQNSHMPSYKLNKRIQPRSSNTNLFTENLPSQ